MALLTVIKEIDSAHGKKIHGHTFKIEVEFKGNVENNMVKNIDFHDIMSPIDEVINELDKKYIDEVINDRGTVENIAIYVIKKLKKLNGLSAVSVWEGKDKYVKIFSDEI